MPANSGCATEEAVRYASARASSDAMLVRLLRAGWNRPGPKGLEGLSHQRFVDLSRERLVEMRR